jgi:hypothetical protein
MSQNFSLLKDNDIYLGRQQQVKPARATLPTMFGHEQITFRHNLSM